MPLIGLENFGLRFSNDARNADSTDARPAPTPEKVEQSGKTPLVEIVVIDDSQKPLSMGNIKSRPTPQGFKFNNPSVVPSDYNPNFSRVLTFALHPSDQNDGERARKFLKEIDPTRRERKLYDALVEAIIDLITKDDKTFYVVNAMASNIKESRMGEKKRRTNEAFWYHWLFRNACREAFNRYSVLYPKSPVRLIVDI